MSTFLGLVRAGGRSTTGAIEATDGRGVKETEARTEDAMEARTEDATEARTEEATEARTEIEVAATREPRLERNGEAAPERGMRDGDRRPLSLVRAPYPVEIGWKRASNPRPLCCQRAP